MRVVFAGTPRTAVPSLRALLASRHTVAAVLTRPDAPAGRGLRVGPSPVAEVATAAGVEVLRPARPRDPDFLARLRAIGPDCCPITAYGALIPPEALDIPPQGWINLHFSLLPAWRGAAPVQHAILHGDDITGATTFRLVAELDAGPVFGVLTEPVKPTDTAGDLQERLSVAGAGLLVATLDGVEAGTLTARPQPADGISLAPKITPADAEVRWSDPAPAIGRLIRACTPSPGAWTRLDGIRVKLGPLAAEGVDAAPPAEPGDGSGAGTAGPAAGLRPGQVRVLRDRILGDRVLVGTGTTPVQLGEVQQHGKRRMPAADWARGLRLDGGAAVFG
jgi:methionyl-tRNA formyltransferase